MAEVLGKLEKPSAEKFKAKRKLYLVPLFFAGQDAPGDYLEKITSYWKQAGEHLENLEQKIGQVKKIYHESVSLPDERGLEVVEKINEKGYPLVKNMLARGAQLLATEDMDLFTQNMDWANCLRVVISRSVLETVSGFYRQASEERYSYIARRIDETLAEEEAGVLFIGEGHSLQFSPSIQVFYISPPALDDVRRWLREWTRGKHSTDQQESSS